MKEPSWKVGDIAKRTGITVRTLHHYDRIGLFSPSRVTEAGHRLYTEADVGKLLQIIRLKQLGFRLDEIKSMFGSPDYSVREMLELQMTRLTEEIRMLTELRGQVEDIDRLLQSGGNVSGERLMLAIHLLKMAESRHFRAEQSEEMKRQFKSVDEWELNARNAEGASLLADFRRLYEQGRSTEDPEVQMLAEAWKRGIMSWVHADEAFVESAEQYYADHPDDALAYGMNGELYQFIKQAVAAIT